MSIKTDIELWSSPVECDLNPPWGSDTIPHWVTQGFPSCINEYAYTDPETHARVSLDPPDLNWYDCFCLSFNKTEGSGKFSVLSCGSTAGVCTATAESNERMYDSTKNWKDNNTLAGSTIINNTKGYVAIVVSNDHTSLKASLTGEAGPPYTLWDVNDSYELSSPGSLTFSIGKTEGADCCMQSYEYSYDFTLPCLPHNLTAATKLWYKYVVNCTKYHEDGTAYTQKECEDLWNGATDPPSNPIKSICSIDTVKFNPAYIFTEQTIASVAKGDASSIVKPQSFENNNILRLFRGDLSFSANKPFAVVPSPLSATSIVQYDPTGEAGASSFPQPVPFDIVRLYPEPGTPIQTNSVDVLVTVRHATTGDHDDVSMFAYFEDNPEIEYYPTKIVLYDSQSPDEKSHYRFWKLSISNSDGTSVIPDGQNRTLVIVAYQEKGSDPVRLYSSRIRATYTKEASPSLEFLRMEPASGSYTDISRLVFSCELNSRVSLVSLIDSASVVRSCVQVPGTNRWYYAKQSYDSVTYPVYFRAYKDGALYSSELITATAGGSIAPTVVIPTEPLQQVPASSSSVVRGEFIQIMGYTGTTDLSGITFARTGNSSLEPWYRRYSDSVSYDIYVFVSDQFTVSAKNKFFNVEHSSVPSLVDYMVDLVNTGKINMSNVSDPATADGYFNNRTIVLYDLARGTPGAAEIGRYIITSSRYNTGVWTLNVSVTVNWPASTCFAYIEPAASFPASIAKTFNTLSAVDAVTVSYNPVSSLPTQTYVDFDSNIGQLLSVYPPVSNGVLTTRNMSTEVVVECPEATSADIVKVIVVPPAVPNIRGLLKTAVTGMDAEVAGVYSGRIEADTPSSTPYYLVTVHLGESFAYSFIVKMVVDSSCTYPYLDGSNSAMLYPSILNGTYISRAATLPVHQITRGYSEAGLPRPASSGELSMNGTEIKLYRGAVPASPAAQYALLHEEIDGTHTGVSSATLTDSAKNWVPGELVGRKIVSPSQSAVAMVITNNSVNTINTSPTITWSTGDEYVISPSLELHILGSRALWSDPFAGVGMYAGKSLIMTAPNTGTIQILNNTSCSVQSDTYITLYLNGTISPTSAVWTHNSTITLFAVMNTNLLSFQEDYSPMAGTKVYQRRLYTPGVGDGPQYPDSTYGDKLTFIWNNAHTTIPWLAAVDKVDTVPLNMDGSVSKGTGDHSGQTGIVLNGLGATLPGIIAENALKYKTVVINRMTPVGEEIGVYQILANDAKAAGATTMQCWLNISDLTLPGSGVGNTYMAIIGIRNAFTQYLFTLCGVNGGSATYQVVGNSGIANGSSLDSITFILDSRAYPDSVLADGWSHASLEISSDVTGVSPDGVEIPYDARWGMPMLQNADGKLPFLAIWPLAGDCEEFYITREQTTQAQADESASYVDCGAECEFDITINGASFKCDFGFKVIGRSVNIAGCGGGGMFTDMYISCPWAKHIHCDRPTAPCNCVFVLSYLLVIPLGSVLL